MSFLVLELDRNIKKSRNNFGNVKYARTFLIFRNFVDQIYSEGPLVYIYIYMPYISAYSYKTSYVNILIH